MKDASFNESFELGASCSVAIFLHLRIASFPFPFPFRDLIEPIARLAGERLKGTTASRDGSWRGISAAAVTDAVFFFIPIVQMQRCAQTSPLVVGVGVWNHFRSFPKRVWLVVVPMVI